MENLKILFLAAAILFILSACKAQNNLISETEKLGALSETMSAFDETRITEIFETPPQMTVFQTETSDSSAETETARTTADEPAETSASETATSAARATIITEAATEQKTAAFASENADDALSIMPDIVFIVVTQYDDLKTENILGHYITSHGEIKFFNFRIEKPYIITYEDFEEYSINKAYHRLEEATYSEYCGMGDSWEFDYRHSEALPSVSNLEPIPESKLTELYNSLLLIEKDNKAEEVKLDPFEPVPDVETTEIRNYYGVRYNDENEIEIVLIQYWDNGPTQYIHTDPTSEILYRQLAFDGLLPPAPANPLRN